MTGTNFGIFLIFLAPLIALFATARTAAIATERKIDRLTAKLDLLLKANGIDPDPPIQFSDRVRKAAAAGRKIEAIKLLREETGLGLRDAKDAVDKWMG